MLLLMSLLLGFVIASVVVVLVGVGVGVRCCGCP